MVSKTIVITGGGTGGHIFPGLALANYLREKQIHIYWMGTEKGMESRLIPPENIPIEYLSVTGIRGKGWLALLKAPWNICKAVYQARKIFKKIKPDAVIGFGGFVSAPGGIAAKLLGIPLFIHEQNAVAGSANRFLSHLAVHVFAGFPHAFPASSRISVVGNPVRQAIIEVGKQKKINVDPNQSRNILILGGSQGAKAINENVPEALHLLSQSFSLAIWHQAGEKQFEETKKRYESLQQQAEVTPFIHDMAKAFKWADIVICRAGASTVAELAAAALPSVLIPLPTAIDNHQQKNAEFLADSQAAILLKQAELSPEKLGFILKSLLQDPLRLQAMSVNAHQRAYPQTLPLIYESLRENF